MLKAGLSGGEQDVGNFDYKFFGNIWWIRNLFVTLQCETHAMWGLHRANTRVAKWGRL